MDIYGHLFLDFTLPYSLCRIYVLHYHRHHHDSDHPPGQRRRRARDEQPFQDVNSGRQESHLCYNIVQVVMNMMNMIIMMTMTIMMIRMIKMIVMIIIMTIFPAVTWRSFLPRPSSYY